MGAASGECADSGQDEGRDARVAHLDPVPGAPETGRAAPVEVGDQQSDQGPGRERIAGGLVVGQMPAPGVGGHLARRKQRERRAPHPHRDDEGGQAQGAQRVSPALPPIRRQAVEKIEHQRQGQEEQHLAVPGQRRHRQHGPCAGRPAGASPRQRAVGQPQEQRQPGRRGVEVQVADVGHEQIGEGEGDAPCQRGGPAQTQPAGQGEQTGAGHPHMEDDQRLHHGVGGLADEGEGQEVDRVEDAGLVVGDEGGAAVEMGIPQRHDAGAQAAGGEAVHGPQKRDQVPAAARDPPPGEEQRPEEEEDDEEEDEQGGYVALRLPKPNHK
jgi:hypothetical protein